MRKKNSFIPSPSLRKRRRASFPPLARSLSLAIGRFPTIPSPRTHFSLHLDYRSAFAFQRGFPNREVYGGKTREPKLLGIYLVKWIRKQKPNQPRICFRLFVWLFFFSVWTGRHLVSPERSYCGNGCASSQREVKSMWNNKDFKKSNQTIYI